MQLGGTASQLYDQARDGIADIVWTLPGMTPGRFPRIEVFELPFVANQRAISNAQRGAGSFTRRNCATNSGRCSRSAYGRMIRACIHTNKPVNRA